MGTAAYMSPEQAAGQTADKRSDVWSFGVVLYEMLTSQRLFTGETVSHVLAKVLDRELDFSALPTSTPASIKRLMRRCLERKPKRRLNDVGEALSDLEDAASAPGEDSSVAAAGTPIVQRAGWRQVLPLALGMSAVAVVITGFAVWNLRPSEPRAVTRFTYDLPASHQLTGRSRAVLAVSPGGRRFVYNTNQGLYLRSMDALEAQLLAGTEGPLRNPSFSPDGRSLVYYDLPASQLKRLALSGGAPVVLCDATNPIGVSWEADGTILFGQPGGIMRVSATGGTPELVIRAAEGELLDGPQLLPDGDTLLFSVSTLGGGAQWDEAQLVAQSLTSGERTILLEGGSDARYVSTGHVIYALADGLFAVAFDVDSLSVLGGPVSLVQGVVRANGAASANYMVSDDGTLFYLADSGGFASPLVWVDRTGSVDVIETIPLKGYGTPRLSSDGEQVLVVADGDAWIYDLASGRETRVTTDGETELYADWTPSGGEVAYTSIRESGGGTNIWIEPADGSGQARQLTALDGLVHFDAWAPDGRTFSAHQHGTGSTNQLMVRFDGTDVESEVWLEREFTDSNAVFSPDGRYVAHVSAQTGQREIQIRPFPGPGGQTTVSVGGGEEPAWAANGELFYRRPDGYAVMVVDVSTEPTLSIGEPRELFRGTVSPGGSPRARYTVTADGTQFLMSADQVASGETATGGSGGPQVTVVLNWFEELKERVPIP